MITPNTSITLGIHEPKKDAVVAIGVPTGVSTDIAIWIGASVNGNLGVSIVGDLIKLHRYALTNLESMSGDTALEIVVGGADADIVGSGLAVVSAGAVQLRIYSYTVDGERSHFLDRTFKRLIERLLEESK